MVVYLKSQSDDTPVELKPVDAPTAEAVVRAAKSAVQNMSLSRGRFRDPVIGFVVENQNGEEVHRWYDETLARRPSLGP